MCQREHCQIGFETPIDNIQRLHENAIKSSHRPCSELVTTKLLDMSNSRRTLLVSGCRDFLCIDVDDTQISRRSKGTKVLIFLGLSSLRLGVTAVTPDNEWILLMLGNHFQNWGDGFLWTMTVFNVTLVVFATMLISHVYQKSNPDVMTSMAKLIREFVDGEQYNSRYYKFMLEGSKLAKVLFVLVATSADVFSVLDSPSFSEKFVPLMISSFWAYNMSAIAYYVAAVLGIVSIVVDIMCRKLRSDFGLIQERLGRKGGDVLTLRLFNKFCGDVARYDSHWKRVLFAVVIGLSIFLAFGLHLYMFGALPPLLRVTGTMTIAYCYVFVSFCLLAPASVCSSARRLHSRFCSLVFRTRQAPRMYRFKLVYTVKRFQNQISFSLWNTNNIDYMDHVNVSNFLTKCLY